MIFIANVLAMNGGTTFLIRICRELCRKQRKVAVLVLFPIIDETLRKELQQYAQIFELKDFLWDRGVFFRAQMMTFSPVRWGELLGKLKQFGNFVHVMGVFGLLFACRANSKNKDFRISLGVYHQNEYLFEANSNYFVSLFRKCFHSIAAKQILFFNQINIANYTRFFERDLSDAILAPIGIDLPVIDETADRQPQEGKLISIGNLVNFKTYNRHIIEIVASLADRFPNVHYDIYGTGDQDANLKLLVKTLGAEKRVNFFGEIPYSQFQEIVNTGTLFIGSGTALLEAAALKVPAMVGIESLDIPETYGFLSDVIGLSYNEYIPEIPRVLMHNLIVELLSDAQYAKSVGEKCRIKAKEFSVEITASSIVNMSDNADQKAFQINAFQTLGLFVSFLLLAVIDRFGVDSTFRNRRHQSYGLR